MLTTLFLIGPRAAILVWWLIDTTRWEQAFDSIWVALLGFVFVPWTTLMYVLVARGGVTGFDWIWIALAVVADVAMWSGGWYGNRGRIQTA